MCKHILIRDFSREDFAILRSFCSKTFDRDGFGAIIRRTDGSLDAFKSLSAPALYLELGAELSRGNVSEVVVHHRTSTNGSGLDYAHPFDFQGHYMTHNGVVTVPGAHDTKTTNDSEALLHHFVKTGFNTKAVSGYFSTFVLNADSTAVLVDEIAPIYTDGRVFCSLDLGGMTRITKKRITFTRDGSRHESEIELVESDYGKDKAHLSLGNGSKVVPIKSPKRTRVRQRWPVETDQTIATEFIDVLSLNSLMEIEQQPSRRAAKEMVLRLANFHGFILSRDQVELILDDILPESPTFDHRGLW